MRTLFTSYVVFIAAGLTYSILIGLSRG